MIRYTRLFIPVLLLCAAYCPLYGQGVSVSYLIPKNGYLAAPVSPFSVRDPRLPFTSHLGLQGGATLYLLPGLPVVDLPFGSTQALRGSTAGILLPVEAYIGFKNRGLQVVFSGGVLGMAFFNDRIIAGNWDRAYARYRGWEVANGDLDLTNKPGWGWTGGVSLDIPVSRRYSISFGVRYLDARAASPLSGRFTGAAEGSGLITETVSFDRAQTRLSGLELSFGVSF